MTAGRDRAPGARGLVVGLVGAAAIGAGVPYCNMVLQGSRIASHFNTPAAIILFVLAGVVNGALGRWRPSWRLGRGELVLVYVMWIVATSIPEYGLTSFLLTDITAVVYYATPENGWRESLWPFIPDWIIPERNPRLIGDFYEGLPQGAPVPWDIWLQPLAFWILFATALYLSMIAVAVILRRQWVERERLVYPLVQLPLAMVGRDEGSPGDRSFFANPLMWLGFGIPAILQTINGLNPYFPHIPRIYWEAALPVFRDTVTIPLRLSFQMVGFAFLVNRGIAFGLCFFYLLNVVQQGCFNLIGVQEFNPVLGPYSRYGGSVVVHQGFGAMIVLVLFGLWTARRHLKGVVLRAWDRSAGVDDTEEIFSYRTALLLLLFGLSIMAVWLWRSGLPGWIVPLYLALAFLIFVGITRVVAEGGLPYMHTPMIASDFVAVGLGTSALGHHGVVSLAFTYVWASDINVFIMASVANGLKLVSETLERHRRLIFTAILLSIAVSIAGSVWAMIVLAYRYGGINTDAFFFNYVNRLPFENAASRLTELQGPHWDGWIYTGIGAAVMALLMVAHHRFLWWPLHPLGFPISAVTGSLFFSVLVALVIKSVVLNYGGPRLYLTLKPLFLGLILGQFVTAGFWLAVSYVTGVPGGYNYLSGFL